MAKIYPPKVNSDASAAHRTIYESLALLPDEFTVIQNVRFTDPQGNRAGAIDFLIIHPSLGLLVVGVSGGLVRLADSQWRSSEPNGSGDRPIANPYRQAQESRVAFSRWLRADSAASQYAAEYNRHIESAVALPNVELGQTNLGLNASAHNTIDRADLPNPEAALRRVMSHAEVNYQLSAAAIALLVGKLTQPPAAPVSSAAPTRPVAAPALPVSSGSSLGGRTISLLTVFIALIVVAVLVALLLGGNRKVNNPPTVAALTATIATVTPSPVPVLAIATATDTAAPIAATDTPLPPTLALPSPTPILALAVGADAVVSASDGLHVRKQPSASADQVIKLAQGVRVHIIGGPQQADGYTWWQIVGWPQDNGDSGWCAGDFLQPVAKQQ